MSTSTSSATSHNPPSTGKSYVESATGAIQNAIGSLTGNTHDQAAGEAKKDHAEREYEASQATVKGPGFTASSSGALKSDDPNRSAGSWNQTIGSAKEAVGGLVGSENLKTAGREQHQEGEKQEARGQLSDLSTGATERLKGAVGSTLAGVTGNKQAERDFQRQHDEGKTQQRGAEHDIIKQNQAAKGEQY